jgi:hypothetical protein
MPCLATQPQAMSFEDGAKEKQHNEAPISIFEVAMSKFHELQAASTVLLGEIGDLEK